jgi:hypothetical protein
MGRKYHVVPLREDLENDEFVAAVGYFSTHSPHSDNQLSSTKCRTGTMYRRAHLSLQLYLLRCVEFRLSITYRADALARHISHDTDLRTLILSDNDVLRKNLDGRETDFVEKYMSAARVLQTRGASETRLSCTCTMVRNATVCNVCRFAQPL